MGSRCTQARFLEGRPARLRSTSESQLCSRCEESDLSPHGQRAREPLEPPPAGEEEKARAFKDGLVVELFLRNGPFWTAVHDLRKKRNIDASRRMPPSGPEISGLILPDMPEEEHDFFEAEEEWVADLRTIEERCVPARLRGAAEWEDFISVCVLFDPPANQDLLDAFARHGDPVYFDLGRPGAKGDRAPMRAAAPTRRMVLDEVEIENVAFWFTDRVLEELGRRYLAPAGVDVDEAVETIIESTGLNDEYHRKKWALHREWCIIAADGVNANDVKRAAAKLPTVREARSSGGRAPRNRLVALQCALFYDAVEGSAADLSKGDRSQILASRYRIPENEVDEYVRLGRDLLSEAQ